MRLIDADALRLIDANTLVEAILDARRSETETVLKLIRLIEAQPTVEPKTGRWVTHGVAKGSEMCDQCGFVQLRYRVNNYCPNCGARMENSDEAD